MCTHSHNVHPATDLGAEHLPPWPRAASELMHATALLLLVYALLLLATLSRPLPSWNAAFCGAAMATQLWAPMRRADSVRQPTQALGLNTRAGAAQLGFTIALLAIMLSAWALGLQLVAALWPAVAPAWSAEGLAPMAWILAAANQLLGVALPEELFWRGYLQPVLEERAARQGGKVWATINKGTLQATLLFALGHVLGGAPLQSVATFFPGLVFAALRNRFDSLLSPVLLHAGCNLGAAAMIGSLH